MPVGVVDPLGQLIRNVRRPGIHRRPELLEHRPLHRFGEELGTAIGLHAVTAELLVKAAPPAGSRFKGYQDIPIPSLPDLVRQAAATA